MLRPLPHNCSPSCDSLRSHLAFLAYHIPCVVGDGVQVPPTDQNFGWRREQELARASERSLFKSLLVNKHIHIESSGMNFCSNSHCKGSPKSWLFYGPILHHYSALKKTVFFFSHHRCAWMRVNACTGVKTDSKEEENGRQIIPNACKYSCKKCSFWCLWALNKQGLVISALEYWGWLRSRTLLATS